MGRSRPFLDAKTVAFMLLENTKKAEEVHKAFSCCWQITIDVSGFSLMGFEIDADRRICQFGPDQFD